LIDVKERDGEGVKNVAEAAFRQISGNLQFLASLNVLKPDLVNKIVERVAFFPTAELETALADAEVVFEAVPEVMDVKRQTFARVSKAVSAQALLASTTSTFLVDTLAAFVENPERFMNTHWLNPAYLIPLVEVSPGESTAPEALKKMMELLEAAGKMPVKVSNRPGFIVPRIQALAMNEAARLIEEGVASPEDVDKASRYGFGIRFAVLGLLEFIDFGGGDILYYASNYLQDALQDKRYAPADIIVKNMEKGDIGMKTGRGFYDFTQMDVSAYQKETIRKFVDLLKHLQLIPAPYEGEKDSG
jgi:3-hydroxybutyryl-CoA dehydrogenase